MQEYQVTINGVRYELERPPFVLATQNPINQEATYPLPDDRNRVEQRVRQLPDGWIAGPAAWLRHPMRSPWTFVVLLSTLVGE